VISVFSDAYSDIPTVNLNPFWGQTTVTTVESIAGSEVLKMAGLNYQGIEMDPTYTVAQDLSGMDTLHLDFWTADATAVNVFLISPGPGDPIPNVEQAYALPVSTGGWISVDIPLSSFSPVDLTTIIQMKFDDANTGEAATIFLDNIYGSTGLVTIKPHPKTASLWHTKSSMASLHSSIICSLQPSAGWSSSSI